MHLQLIFKQLCNQLGVSGTLTICHRLRVDGIECDGVYGYGRVRLREGMPYFVTLWTLLHEVRHLWQDAQGWFERKPAGWEGRVEVDADVWTFSVIRAFGVRPGEVGGFDSFVNEHLKAQKKRLGRYYQARQVRRAWLTAERRAG